MMRVLLEEMFKEVREKMYREWKNWKGRWSQWQKDIYHIFRYYDIEKRKEGMYMKTGRVLKIITTAIVELVEYLEEVKEK